MKNLEDFIREVIEDKNNDIRANTRFVGDRIQDLIERNELALLRSLAKRLPFLKESNPMGLVRSLFQAALPMLAVLVKSTKTEWDDRALAAAEAFLNSPEFSQALNSFAATYKPEN
jgi:hypothetical protein